MSRINERFAYYREAFQRQGVRLLFGSLSMAVLLALLAWLVFRSIASSTPPVYLVGLWAGWLVSGMVIGVGGTLSGVLQQMVLKPHSRSFIIGSLLVLFVSMALTHGIIHSLMPLHIALNGVGALLMALGGFFGFILQLGTLGLAQTLVRLVWHGVSMLRRPQLAEVEN